MQNQGATLVCELRLGDQVWSYGDNLGTVVALELLAEPKAGPARPRMQVTTVNGELWGPRRITYTFLCIDRVHVGTSLVTSSHDDNDPIPPFDGTSVSVRTIIEAMAGRRL